MLRGGYTRKHISCMGSQSGLQCLFYQRCGGFCEGPICLMHQSRPPPARIWLDKQATEGQPLTQGRVWEGMPGGGDTCTQTLWLKPLGPRRRTVQNNQDPDLGDGPTWVQPWLKALKSFDLWGLVSSCRKWDNPSLSLGCCQDE